ncbi:MAG: hypothetical protein JOZ37_03110 [Actinobacteria bacterium]|nr:hypothetical protein [Actinomycetota bacterium]MBV9662931.1 hypothetical protein [Actinomycetota bacterium]MBV9933527.1 hypothetical protein [Actinomycetota bacterium]
MHHLLSALTWDPQLRGYLIALAAILAFPGSVYLLLATNMGAKIGFLLAVAGLSGWMMTLGIVWAVFGIGMRGNEPTWKVKEVITGDVARSTVPVIGGFPKGWTKLPPGNAELADAQAAADAVLAPSATPTPGKEASTSSTPAFQSPFKTTADYVTVTGYRKGGDNSLFAIRKHKFFLRHSAHYDVIQVRPALNQTGGPGGAPPRAIADPSQPITSVIMERDLGTLRLPQTMLALFSGVIFAVTCYALHRRDKEIMALRQQQPAPA